MPKNNNLPKGKLGESIACQYLKQKGYHIIARNIRNHWDELDIIAIFNKKLIFIEVKTRWNYRYGTPEESITPWKLRRLIKACQYFSMTHPNLPKALQIDAVGIDFSNNKVKPVIRHFANITL